MIISHGRKYIFVHIPKTGGTSLSLVLEAKAMKDDLLIGDTPKAKSRRNRAKGMDTSGRLWKHSRLADIYGLVTQQQIESYFVFTIIRNPWDRMVSYYHWLKIQKFDHPAVRCAHEYSFTDFLSDPMIKHSLQNDAAQKYVSDHSGVDRCDLYLRLEFLQQDTGLLEQHLEIKLKKLPHDNRSKRDRDYAGYYDAQSKNIIAKVFAADIEKFKYRF
jgi:hypothetical protein